MTFFIVSILISDRFELIVFFVSFKIHDVICDVHLLIWIKKFAITILKSFHETITTNCNCMSTQFVMLEGFALCSYVSYDFVLNVIAVRWIEAHKVQVLDCGFYFSYVVVDEFDNYVNKK